MSDTLTFNVPTALVPSLAVAAAPAVAQWEVATVSSLCEAEAALDAAETAGYQQRELIVRGPELFVVRWR